MNHRSHHRVLLSYRVCGAGYLAGSRPLGGSSENFPTLRPLRDGMRYYERRLPHFEVVGQPLFVTFRLYDSLPANRIFIPEALTSGKAFVQMDRLLDQAQAGPRHLSIPEIAAIVVKAIRDGDQRFGRSTAFFRG